MADHDVAVAGGGPAGASTAVFLARSGLDTVVYDRGRSSIGRCAHLENYLGFPAGIDVETFYALAHDHIEAAGGTLVDDMVESVEWIGGDDDGDKDDNDGDKDDANGFRVTPQEGDPITATRVVAAARYDGEFLRGLDDEDAMFETHDHDGETHRHFARDYADDEGATPVEGLYVASPSPETDAQAIAAAGRGAMVARRVLADVRIADGWWPEAAEGVDWVRREAELTGEWAERERWVEWFDEHHAEHAPVDVDSERFRRVREAYLDEGRSPYLPDEEIEARAASGHRTLAGHLDPEAVVDAHDAADLLDELDDGTIRAYLDGRDHDGAAVATATDASAETDE
ncbi:FAD-dependent monooxygenase [Halobaculum magnesiiphilum]|uniref:NAD(P)-binding protein n=1 Tax=Halobaculum magnesiiphilum TaxID=1017351 RepID=A0A8T8WD01_9EURY|nr:FAD-dependent monooxygenase [Halobaculum magnesiiphilum]QZP37718.1 NAD(P)-binding protein [Halobaculum magnesiiphilum]